MDKEKIEFLEKIEEYLIKADIHIEIVGEIMNFLAKKTLSNNNLTKQDIVSILEMQLKYMISVYIKSFNIDENKTPYVMIVCGVNGSGKTTTLGKMANLINNLSWSVVIGACDTFRSAAKEQIQTWSNGVVDSFICKEHENETATKIALKAYNTAFRDGKDVVLIDTSGRLQNNQNLMAELLKMKQKLHDISRNIPNDVVLVIDSNCGYNALQQAKMYNDLIGITGIIATKVDIAKKPGAILSVCKMFNVPIYGITDGEEKGDINDIEPDKFAKAILCDIDKLY